MKFPALVNFEDYLARTHEFDCIIDVRSPDEFAADHIPGAINCPVLDNEERIKVGTLYKQVSPFEAKKVGAALVAKNIAKHIEAHFLDKPKHWRPLVYCWRGGNRSGSMTHILAKIGWPASQLEGGYKQFRHYVNQAFSELVTERQFVVLCGETGSGKSRLLQTLRELGAQVLDLEELACHRGSVLGHLPSQAQPPQKYFESQLWDQIRRFNPEQSIFVEAESKKIGNIHLPPALMEKMRESACVRIDSPVQQRVAYLMQDYLHFIEDPDRLKHQLRCLNTLYGNEKIDQWCHLIDQNQLPNLVQVLLETHYDPSYRKGTYRNYQQAECAPVFSLNGNETEHFFDLANRLQSSLLTRSPTTSS